MDTCKLEALELEVLESGVWGTVGPYSVSAAKALAEYTGGKLGVLCHSVGAAYEAILRHFGARLASLSHGDVTVVGESSVPADSLVALAVGSSPAFCTVCPDCGMLSPRALVEILKEEKQPIRAVVLDYLTEFGEDYPLGDIYALCKEKGVPFVINAGGAIGVRHNGRALSELCDAVVYSLGEGSAINVGMGGLIVTDRMEILQGAFAYHNCGRGFGEGCSLVMDNILGGDLRVTEWTAAAALHVLNAAALEEAAPMRPVKMKGQPVFEQN